MSRIRQILAASLLAIFITLAPASLASAYSSSHSSFHSSSSSHVSTPHTSSSSSYHSTPSSSSSSRSSSSTSHSSTSTRTSTPPRSTSTYHPTTYNGRTYEQNSSSSTYYNVGGLLIAYWIYNESTHSYSCYDQNHNSTSCNRNTGTVQHGGQTYNVSDKPYTDTANKTVQFYQKKQNNQKKTYFVCYDSSYNAITCNRK